MRVNNASIYETNENISWQEDEPPLAPQALYVVSKTIWLYDRNVYNVYLEFKKIIRLVKSGPHPWFREPLQLVSIYDLHYSYIWSKYVDTQDST